MMAIYIPLVILVVWLFGSMRCNIEPCKFSTMLGESQNDS